MTNDLLPSSPDRSQHHIAYNIHHQRHHISGRHLEPDSPKRPLPRAVLPPHSSHSRKTRHAQKIESHIGICRSPGKHLADGRQSRLPCHDSFHGLLADISKHLSKGGHDILLGDPSGDHTHRRPPVSKAKGREDPLNSVADTCQQAFLHIAHAAKIKAGQKPDKHCRSKDHCTGLHREPLHLLPPVDSNALCRGYPVLGQFHDKT